MGRRPAKITILEDAGVVFIKDWGSLIGTLYLEGWRSISRAEIKAGEW